MIEKFQSLSLRWRLSFLISLVAILTSLAISLAVYFLWTDQIRNQVSQQLEQNTLLATKSIQQQLNYEKDNLSTWSQLDVMVDIITDDVDKRIITTLQLLKKNYNLPGDIIVLNKQNQVIANTGKFIPTLEQTSENLLLPDSNSLLSQAIIQVPIKLSILPDEISGYIVLTHPWKEIVSRLSSFLPEFLIFQNGNKNHYVNGSIDNTESSHAIDILAPQWFIEGEEKLHSFVYDLLITNNNSMLLYGIANKNEALKPVEDTLLLIAAVTIVLLMPIGLLSVWSSTQFVKPIIELQQFAETIAQSGELNTDIPIRSNDEVGRLAKILKRMTVNLKESFEENEKTNEELKLLTENLEIRVEERTLELTQAMSKLKQAQSQLVQSEKMVGLGQLVAGIAHELNNPISSIYANIPILNDYVKDLLEILHKLTLDVAFNNSKLSSWLEDIDFAFLKEDIFSLLNGQTHSAKRIRDIVLSLRNFSRLDEGEIKYSDINEGLDNTINILRHQIKHRIQIHKDYQLTKDVECFPGEINQVLMNILANATQAIDGEGNIWITTRQIDQHVAQIEIRDDGPGVPEKLLNKIFDPFFTTKVVGEGTGLGLSISYGIIEKHHGKINIENATPRGAIFTIELPMSQDENS